MSNTVLEARGVSKQYILGQIGSGTLRQDLDDFFVKWKRSKSSADIDQIQSKPGKKFWALKDISFDVEAGSAVLGVELQR